MLNNILLYINSMLNNTSLEVIEKKKQYVHVPYLYRQQVKAYVAANKDFMLSLWLHEHFVIRFFGEVENIFNEFFCFNQLDFLFSLWLYFHFVNKKKKRFEWHSTTHRQFKK